MVDRYKASTGVSAAPIAKPQSSGLAEIAQGVRAVANTAVDIATKKVAERTASLEAAALNSARLELEKRGAQLAIDMQNGRVAGSDYVRDLEKERQKLKSEVWATVPKRIQGSTQAQANWNDIWTSSEISSQRTAVAWQAEQETKFAKRTLDEGLANMAAIVEVDPDSAARQLDIWGKGLPTYAGLLDAETLADAQTKGTQVILQGAVRGLSKQGRFDEAEKLVTQAAGKLDPQQRKAFESVIEDARNDIRREQERQDTERNKAQRLAGNRFEADVIDGKVNRTMLDERVKSGEISENDKPTLMRALRAEDDRRKAAAAESKLNASEKAEWTTWSERASLTLQSSGTMTPAQFMSDTSQWPKEYQEIYRHLTPDDQRGIIRKQIEMRETGKTFNEVDRIEAMLLDEAKRIAPTEWKVGSQAANKTSQAVELAGFLRQAAQRMAPEVAGTKLTPDQVRDATALALGQIKGAENLPVVTWSKFRADLGSADNTMDQATYNEAFEAFRKQYGRDPSMAEARAAYNQLAGAQ